MNNPRDNTVSNRGTSQVTAEMIARGREAFRSRRLDVGAGVYREFLYLDVSEDTMRAVLEAALSSQRGLWFYSEIG